MSIVTMFVLGAIISCGGSKQAEAPESLIRDYVAKHRIMIDTSLVDLYIDEEQANISAKISQSIEEKKQAGTLQGLQQASFDYSGLKIDVLGQKESYVHDEPVDFLKISAHGNLVMKVADRSKTMLVNDVIILEKIGNSWKVTEETNPWG